MKKRIAKVLRKVAEESLVFADKDEVKRRYIRNSKRLGGLIIKNEIFPHRL